MILSIKKVLMERDEMTEAQAQAKIDEAKTILQGCIEDGDNEAAENICEEMFGLEPDYIIELLDK